MTTFKRASIDRPAYTLPGQYFTSAEIFAREQEQIFARQWICVGRSADVPSAGDYRLVEIAGESLILLRDHNQRLCAYYNVCRHRGARLCTEMQGRLGETIVCPYHAWTYRLDGTLATARYMQDAPGFRREDWPLIGATVAEWDGFVFISLASQPVPFNQAFAPLIGKFQAWDVGRLQRGAQIVYEVAANWKLIVANYSECYHCPLIHPELVAVSPWQSGRNDLTSGPFLGGYMDLTHESMTLDGHTRRPPLPGLDPVDRRRVYYYSIFPNLLLSLHPDYVMAHRLLPRRPDATTVICEWYFAPEIATAADFDPSDAVEFWDRTNRQDWHVCELSQQGVSSRAYRPGPYAQSEGLLWQFDQEYLRVMAQE
ncbi:aromatic ring-hydroxylating oxygenase subunit alpha [Chloroflexus sp.]|uniref:aromatic ring-hydroxylating oxygenase subunit alpha n=1 Tax=Chloroflexus sp. TaxID=1904827 RepID=UPI00261D4B40|nr:aromatic ring-hydroxylating dioxygenase subunit alpha [uncultured Chloroflexus sp.]